MQNTIKSFIIFSSLIVCFTNIGAADSSPQMESLEGTGEFVNSNKNTDLHYDVFDQTSQKGVGYKLMLPKGIGLTLDNYKSRIKDTIGGRKHFWCVNGKVFDRKCRATMAASSLLGIRYMCPEKDCGTISDRVDTITRHLDTKKHNANNTVSNYWCHYCKKSFLRNCYLIKHYNSKLCSEKRKSHFTQNNNESGGDDRQEEDRQVEKSLNEDNLAYQNFSTSMSEEEYLKVKKEISETDWGDILK